MTSHLFGHTDTRSLTQFNIALVTHDLRDSLLVSFGEENDPTRGLVSVTAEADADGDVEGLMGTVIDLDVAYDLALVADSSAETGLAPGNTIPSESPGFVVFANAAVGAVNATVTQPDGYRCAVSPGDAESLEFTVYANEISQLIYTCLTL